MTAYVQPTSPEDLTTRGPIDPVEDPYSIYKQMRNDTPVVQLNGKYYVSSFKLAMEVMRDDTVFSCKSNSPEYPGIGMVMGQTLVGMDGLEHQKHRNLVTPALAPKALRGEFPTLALNTANRIIDKFIADGRANLVTDYTFLFPLSVFVQILGLPEEDVDDFHKWGVDLTHVASDPERGIRGSQCMAEYLGPVVKNKRNNSTGDLICKLIDAEIMGEKMTDEEIVNFLRLLVTGGADTTYHLLGNMLHSMMSDPALMKLIVEDRDMIEPMIWESMRWESPVQIVSRQTLKEVEVGGVTIPEDKPVFAVIGAANRDETVFPDPDTFDINRKGETSLAFGFGPHYCAGSRFAILEATIGLNALLDRLPNLRFDPDVEEPAKIIGVAFRSPSHLKALFDN